jgi:hypothetical protein
MTTATKAIRRPTVTLRLPSDAGPRRVCPGHRDTDDRKPVLPQSHTPARTVTAAIDDLRAAETAALSRTKGAAAARNEKRAALVALLQQLRSYIQATADADATNGALIIQSAGVAVRETATLHARTFTARPGPVSGMATVVAVSAARRASYTDSGGSWRPATTWTAAPSTLQAKTRIARGSRRVPRSSSSTGQ